MSNEVRVALNQVGPATTEGVVRDHHVLIDRPQAKGGDDRGAMGGELLLVALGGCFMSNLLAAIRAREAPIRDVRLEVAGRLGQHPSRFEAVAVHVTAACDDRDLLTKLVTMSERSCLVANTLKQAVDLSFTIG